MTAARLEGNGLVTSIGAGSRWLALVLTLVVAAGTARESYAADDPEAPETIRFIEFLASARTIDGIAIPQGEPEHRRGLGFPIDPRDLRDPVTGKAKVFHEYFQGGVDGLSFDGTILFTVFNGANFGKPELPMGPTEPNDCEPFDRILPPDPVTYCSSNAGPITIDFSRIESEGASDQDQGFNTRNNWVYAYAIINDAGESAHWVGLDSVNSVNVGFARALRLCGDATEECAEADFPLPGTSTTGLCITSFGDFDDPSRLELTAPASNLIRSAIGLELFYSKLGEGDGCIPEWEQVEMGTVPLECGLDAEAFLSNTFYMRSSFGPGVTNVTYNGAGEFASVASNVVLAPMTYPKVMCLEPRVVRTVEDPSQPFMKDEIVTFEIDVENLAPPAPPYRGGSYARRLPGGSLRTTVIVRLYASINGGDYDPIDGQCVTLEASSAMDRLGTASFPGIALVSGITRLRAEVEMLEPYPSSPAFEAELDGEPRFPLLMEGDCEATIVVTAIEVAKLVQRVCFESPDDTNGTLEPAEPVERVDAPNCGLVRFTTTVRNRTPDDGLRDVVVTDCLPNNLEFVGNVDPPLAMKDPSEGLPCTDNPNSSPIVFCIPDLGPDGSFTFTFDARVKTAAPESALRNLAQAEGTGVLSQQRTPTASDDAFVDVRRSSAILTGVSVSPPATCPENDVVFTFRLRNDGNWPLDPVRPRAAVLDAGLVLVSQVPPAGTNVGPLDPGATVDFVVTAKASMVRDPVRRCVSLTVDTWPDCFDPRTANACRDVDTVSQCVDVFTPALTVECVTPILEVDCDSPASFDYRVTNTGNVALASVQFECLAPGTPPLTIVQCPAALGRLAPGADRLVTVLVRSHPTGSGQQCATLRATGVAEGLVACTATAEDDCCLSVAPILRVAKRVQRVCHPADGSAPRLEPSTPATRVDAPNCGRVRFTVDVRNIKTSERLIDVRLSDCLPPGLTFAGNVNPPTALGNPGEGPGCDPFPGSSEFVFRIPVLEPAGTAGDRYTFTFDAIVKSDAPSGLQVNGARGVGRGETTRIPTLVDEARAEVDVKRVSARFEAGPEPPTVCGGLDAEFSFTFRNDGEWPLRPVRLDSCEVDPGLEFLSSEPMEGTDLGLVAPGEARPITVRTRTLAGSFAPLRCVSCVVSAIPDCVAPGDAAGCELELDAESCVTVTRVALDVECRTKLEKHVPGDVVPFLFRVRNQGDVAFDRVALTCESSAAAEIVTCPPDVLALAPGAFVDVEVVVRVLETPDSLTRIVLKGETVIAALPEACQDDDEAECFFRTRVPALGVAGLFVLALILATTMLRRLGGA